MRNARITLILSLTLTALSMPFDGQENEVGPKDPRAQKTYNEALQYLHKRQIDAALESFKKADKQDGGHCMICQKKMIKYASDLHDWRIAETAAAEVVEESKTPNEIALAHYHLGMVLLAEGIDKHKDEIFSRAHNELTRALEAVTKFPAADYADGQVMAHLKQDAAAKACFEKYAQMETKDSPQRQRALRYIAQPELARARMAPPFEVTAIDGQQVSLDGLQGKVVLLDFWATWCRPCREALPHMREIAKKFDGQPLVVLSVSLDTDERRWKEFVGKNEMTWPQYFDGGFDGPIAKAFGVRAIPNTFTIDADGVLQDEHIGDASIEGKLKKLVNRAKELQAAQNSQ